VQGQAPAARTKIGDLATVAFPEGWSYLPGKEGQDWLVQRGNRRDPDVLGVARCDAKRIFVVYFYEGNGHVKDDDFDSLESDALLKQMQEGTKQENEERRKAKISTVELLGWAEPPHYDKATKKLYFAERLKFSDSSDETLNYFVRVLGRGGVLQVNAVGDVEQFDEIAVACKELLAATEFVPGKRYTDFDPAYDKIAAYGIGGLIAGNLLLKAGLLKVLAGLWKPIAVGVVAIGAAIARVFKRKAAAAPGQTGSSPQA
jgi:uncharacterized membrane-anchored protein